MDERFWRFVEEHAAEDPQRLRLKHLTRSGDCGFDMALAILQVECRKRYRHKLSGFLGCRTFLFPGTLSGEQSSDEVVARYNASVALRGDVRSVADLTAGLGVDAMTMAQSESGVQVTAFEIDGDTAGVLRHNAEALGLGNVEVMETDSVAWLRETGRSFDVVYADPARRRTDSAGRQIKERRTYGLGDCLPDLTACSDLLPRVCRRLVVKTSPMLDVSKAIADLPGVSEVHVVSLKGECKELLVVCDFEQSITAGSERIVAVDLCGDGSEGSRLECRGCDLGNSQDVEYAVPEAGDCLYEPSAAVMKTGAWGVLARRYGLRKVAPNTHIFVGKVTVEDFPGMSGRVERVLSGREMKALKGERLRVVSRNHPLRAEEVEKRYGLRSPERASRTLYAIGTTSGPALVLVSGEDAG